MHIIESCFLRIFYQDKFLPEFLRQISISVFVIFFCQKRVFKHKFGFCGSIGVAVKFMLFPKRQFQFFVLAGDAYVFDEIIAEVKFVVIFIKTQMKVKDLFRKTMHRVAPIKGFTVISLAHFDIDVLSYSLCGFFHRRRVPCFNKNIHNVFCLYVCYRGAADVTYSVSVADKRNYPFLFLAKPIFPQRIMLMKGNGKQFSQFLYGHFG